MGEREFSQIQPGKLVLHNQQPFRVNAVQPSAAGLLIHGYYEASLQSGSPQEETWAIRFDDESDEGKVVG